ncbi:MAG: hypothetical protein HQL27_04370, partial [Candidatus Omnitrophica bacterium]|nr:hypothetical protein [Candidatus Omnitrophota bacterium]
LREMLYSPLTVVIGRQAFSYGNSLIVASGGIGGTDSGLNAVAGDLSEQEAANAIRAILDYDPLKIEFLYSKIDENDAIFAEGPAANDDVDLYGLNASYELGDKMKTVVESYVFAKIDKEAGKHSTVQDDKPDTVYTPGIRFSTNPLEDLSLSVEYAHQFGNRSGTTAANQQERDANAVQILTSYALPDKVLPGKLKEFKPVLGYEFTYASGDQDGQAVNNANQSSKEKWTGWDPMYENQAGGKIYNAIFNQTNMYVNTVSLTVNPMEDLMTKLSFSKLYLNQELHPSDAQGNFTLNQPDGQGAATLNVQSREQSLGWEVDLETLYDYTEDVQFGLNLGLYNPGNGLFDTESRIASSAQQALLNVKVNF